MRSTISDIKIGLHSIVLHDIYGLEYRKDIVCMKKLLKSASNS